MSKQNLAALVAMALWVGVAHASGAAMPHSGTVLETMDSGGYTYMKVEENGEAFWAAGPPAEVAAGDEVSFVEQMRMRDFRSDTLGRTFEELVFVNGVSGGTGVPGAAAVPAGHPPVATGQPEISMGPVEKAEGGHTVAEVFDRRKDLEGQTVKVRGRVVKVNSNIMGSHWVHLKDGTGTAGNDHVIFRSSDHAPQEGAMVVGKGTLAMDRDLGFGYLYPVLVEDATFTQ